MMTEDIFSVKRLTAILSMLLGLVGLSLFWAFWYRFLLDQILSFTALSVLFFPIFLLFLETERKNGRLSVNTMDSYRRVSRGFLLMLGCYLIFSFLPSYAAPVALPAMLLTLVSNPVVGITGGLYLDMLLCMVSEYSYYELAVYLALTVSGCLLAAMFERKKYRPYMALLIFSISFVLPELFYFLGSLEMRPLILLYGAIGGIISCLVLFLCYDKVTAVSREEMALTLQEIVQPDYPLVKDIKNYSEVDYLHAMHVSKTAYQCALHIGADAEVASAAGFYYRLGKLLGEPFIENGVLLAAQNCFPVSVIEILKEYNGEQKLPSTQESAIVHIADAVITKFELLDKDTLSSTWNRDMVIYQTLNEKSAAGIYDESGLSMNQYLKVREYLTKGVILF